MDTLYFSIGTDVDVPAIVEINNSHFDYENPNGFLVIHFDEEYVKELIESGDVQFFLVKDVNDYVLGYVEVRNSLNNDLLNDMNWINDDLKELTISILSGHYIYVKQLAVRRGYQRMGVASYAYQKMEQTVGCPVVVFTANKPRRNIPSIQFHENKGYTRVSSLHRMNFGEFSEYEAFFYVKKP
ncbi:MAG: GNAT family N-acetyltransferase [Candidatus Thorarchaeota archaeon]